MFCKLGDARRVGLLLSVAGFQLRHGLGRRRLDLWRPGITHALKPIVLSASLGVYSIPDALYHVSQVDAHEFRLNPQHPIPEPLQYPTAPSIRCYPLCVITASTSTCKSSFGADVTRCIVHRRSKAATPTAKRFYSRDETRIVVQSFASPLNALACRVQSGIP